MFQLVRQRPDNVPNGGSLI